MKKFFRNLGLWIRGNTANLSLAIIVLGFVGMFLLLIAGQQHQAEQVANENKILLELKDANARLVAGAAQRTDQFNQLNQHMDCIVQFFAQEDRNEKKISDINDCELANVNTGKTTTPSTPTNKSSTPAQSSPAQTTPAGNSGSSTQTQNNPPAVKQPTILEFLLTPVKGIVDRL
ncbi:MAG TPA: hypothetical protein VN081_05205, partial [Dongiaceae bacterium]|nr:hypothetical protein [Dongiaceae bacterium]